MLKILALHGLISNGESMQLKMRAIEKAIAPHATFYWADAPVLAKPIDMQGGVTGRSAQVLDTPVAGDAAPRGWWTAEEETSFDPQKNIYYGDDESLEYIKGLMAKEKFDGVFGFSQGAAFAGLLCALLEKPDMYPSFLVDGKPPQEPFKFAIFVGGYKPLDAKLQHLFKTKLLTPNLHVLGANDFIVVERRNLNLVGAFEKPRVDYHNGGHFVPTSAPWRKFFPSYIASFAPESTIRSDDVPSPNGSPMTRV